MADTYTETGDKLVLLMQEAILTLPTMQRTVFNLRYYDELPYEEIAPVSDDWSDFAEADLFMENMNW